MKKKGRRDVFRSFFCWKCVFYPFDQNHQMSKEKERQASTFVRHVTIADGGHRHDGPPEGIRDGLEVGKLRAGLGKIDGT